MATDFSGLWAHVPSQTLFLIELGSISQAWPMGTARNGLGEAKGSFQTPRGRFKIRAKIGEGAALGQIFRGRRPSGTCYDKKNDVGGGDWILTRILWLSGCEPGQNRLGAVDTMQRYVYIHGSPDHYALHRATSSGCINLHNATMKTVFAQVNTGTNVQIQGHGPIPFNGAVEWLKETHGSLIK